MKNKYFALIMVLLLLAGCLDDDGTYKYKELERPVWETSFIEQQVRSGEIVNFRATPYFSWAKDSSRRASEVRYEWKYNGVILGEEADFEVSAEEVLKKTGITKFDGKEKYGSFSIIEKEGGQIYTIPVHFKFLSTYSSKDWFVISEKDGNTHLGMLRMNRGENGWEIAFKEDLYKEANGEDMLGHPLSIHSADGARNIGSLGSVTVFTDQQAYEINCENIRKVGNLEDAPVEGRVVLRKDNFDVYAIGFYGMHTYIVGEDGCVYRRVMSKNGLAGSFETEPLFLDTKGYQISHFGQCLKDFDDQGIPCYDAKNRRIIFISFYYTMDEVTYEQYLLSKLVAAVPQAGTTVSGCAQIWDMPEGTKPLHLWNIFERYASFYKVGMIYNDAAGNTRLTVAVTDMATRNIVPDEGNIDMEFPGGKLDETSCILTSSAPDESYYAKTGFILYSKGNEIRYVNVGDKFSDHPYITLKDADDRVAFMKWAVDYYRFLVVGTEKGKIYVYADQTRNVSGYSKPLPENPKLLSELSTENKFVDGVEVIADETFYHKDRY